MNYASVPASRLGAANTWSARHHIARQQPNEQEWLLVSLLNDLEKLVEKFGDDGVLRDGVAAILAGTGELLNADWGPNLDMGSVDSELTTYAERMNYDRDRDEFRNQ